MARVTLASLAICAIIRRIEPQVGVDAGTLVDQVLSAMTMPHLWTRRSRIAKAGFLSCAILTGGRFLAAQELMPASGPGGSVRLFTSDAAILEAQDTRKDLPCTVTAVKPQLGFDLKFHSGYDVSVPLKE